MKLLKLFLIFILGLSFTFTFRTAFAAENWVRYEVNETAETFIDTNSVRVNGSVTSYRILQNFKKRLTPALSIVTLLEMKCAEKSARYITGTSYTESFGKGKVVGGMDAAMLGFNAASFSPIENAQLDQYPLVCRR